MARALKVVGVLAVFDRAANAAVGISIRELLDPTAVRCSHE
jgi:hypothetical protein